MKYFGTDGIRGAVTSPLLDPTFVYRVGAALGEWLRQQHGNRSIHLIIGRDTRASGQSLFMALLSGLSTRNIRVFDGGIVPTPAVSAAILELDLDLGIVLTASHNPASDNGIKLFGSKGSKLSEAEETEIEYCIDQIPAPDHVAPCKASAFAFDARRHYIERLRTILRPGSLTGWKIVVDTANGATCRTTPEVLRELGVQVIQMGDHPNGENINDGCGSEHPEPLQKKVLEMGARLGIGHDGDGDRLILVDEKGTVLDGDCILAGLALHDQNLGESGVVVTCMSNLALDTLLKAQGYPVHRVGVGDRQVFWKMLETGARLGGESSGHFILMDHLPTGDGPGTLLTVLKQLTTSGESLSQWASAFAPWPQKKKNLPVRTKINWEDIPGFADALNKIEEEIGESGRLLLRYSGTENKIRLLVEGEDEAVAEAGMAKLEKLVRSSLEVND